MKDELRNNDEIEPEQWVLVGVIRQAIEDLEDKDPVVARSAKRWICEDREPDVSLFNSFINTCDNLGLNPDMVRDRIIYGDGIPISVV